MKKEKKKTRGGKSEAALWPHLDLFYSNALRWPARYNEQFMPPGLYLDGNKCRFAGAPVVPWGTVKCTMYNNARTMQRTGTRRSL